MHFFLKLHEGGVVNQKYSNTGFYIIFTSALKIFCLFLERGKETLISCLSHAPNQGPSLQSKNVPWWGVEPVTFWFAGQCSVLGATPARAFPPTIWRDSFSSPLQFPHMNIPCSPQLMHYSVQIPRVLTLSSSFSSGTQQCGLESPWPFCTPSFPLLSSGRSLGSALVSSLFAITWKLSPGSVFSCLCLMSWGHCFMYCPMF